MELTREEESSGLGGLGLIENPFIPPADGPSEPLGGLLSVQAAAFRLLTALDAAASDPDHKPIVVEKSPEIPSYYFIAALARVFSSIAQGNPVPGILQAYVPIDMMRIGRVRAPLGIVAERVSGPGVDLTIAAWSRVALVDPDRSLPEFSHLETIDLGALVSEIDADPAGFTARVFGGPDARRVGSEDTEIMMRIATSRTSRLDTDPAEESEDDSSGAAHESELPTDDPMASAFLAPHDEVGVGDAMEASAQTDASPPLEKELAEYLIAYTHVHLSPVVARGIRVFSAQGTDAMAQELKVSKAPSKTLAALLRFAETRMRLGAILFDNFDIWPSVPDDLRLKIVATFSQLRWSLKNVGVLVFLVTPGAAPEVEEAFSSGRHVSWDFAELFNVADDGAAFDPVAATTWLRSASRDGELPAWGEQLIAVIPADAVLESACSALAAEIARAADFGTLPDPASVRVSEIDRIEQTPA